MKILAFADLHGDKKALQKVIDKSSEVDLVLCAGDLTIFENDLPFFIRELSKIKKNVLLVHGNHEFPDNLKKEISKYQNLHFIHKSIYTFKDVYFLGWGGGGFSIRDAEFEHYAEHLGKAVSDKPFIMLVHGPPHGTKVDYLNKGHVGCKTITDFIKKHQPHIVFCGHLHELTHNMDKIGKTLVINPGPKGVVINM